MASPDLSPSQLKDVALLLGWAAEKADDAEAFTHEDEESRPGDLAVATVLVSTAQVYATMALAAATANKGWGE